MDTMAILMATTMETIVTGIMVAVILGVAPVIGDETEGGGNASNLLRPYPLV